MPEIGNENKTQGKASKRQKIQNIFLSYKNNRQIKRYKKQRK
jgi:hypothetical protein